MNIQQDVWDKSSWLVSSQELVCHLLLFELETYRLVAYGTILHALFECDVKGH